MMDFSGFQKILGYCFSDEGLLRMALIHSSVSSDNSKGVGGTVNRDFDRLEFLGDRVVNLLIAELLYEKFPKEREGDLAHRYSRLVCFETCAVVAEKIKLQDFLNVAAKTSLCDMRVLCDALEAVVGAMYLDGGLQVCRTFVKKHWEEMLMGCALPPCDPKSELQEIAQAQWKTRPEYDTVERTGPEHEPLYKVSVCIAGAGNAIGVGKSKKVAEKDAAQNLLCKIKKC